MKKRKELPVKHNPGIYRLVQMDESSKVWMATGSFRAMRRIFIDGESKKEQGVFRSLEDAKAFREGNMERVPGGRNVHQRVNEESQPSGSLESITFGALVEEWKSFHYLQLELSTKQMYDRRMPHLEFLFRVPVEKIKVNVIDELVKYWMTDHPKWHQRFTFEKELNLLKVVLNYYRKRKNPAYVIPVLEEHYKAADVARRPKQPVQHLTTQDLGRFLEHLKKGINPNYYVLALAQFSFGLRAGEVCGLAWRNLNLETRVVVIDQVVTWHHETWEPTIKGRPKNGKVRVLMIPEFLVQELTRLKATRSSNSDLVFHRKGVPYCRKEIGKVYNRALQELGITHVSGTHMMRRTAATLANEATGDFYAVSNLLDHSSPEVTLRYVSQTTAQKSKVAVALNGVLGQALNRGAENFCPTEK
jgi:integrase